MVSIKHFISTLFLAATFYLISGSAKAQNQEKPVDLYAENTPIEQLIKTYPQFSLNKDSSIILAGFIFPYAATGYKGDSLVFKFDENKNLKFRERYYGDDPEQLNFKCEIFRNSEGIIDSLESTLGEPEFKHSFKLFPKADNNQNLKGLERAKGLVKTTYYYRYDSNKQHYYRKSIK